jgi:Flp pilus assembly pilin Flp
MKELLRILRNEKGVTALEYTILAFLIIVTIVAATLGLTGRLQAIWAAIMAALGAGGS